MHQFHWSFLSPEAAILLVSTKHGESTIDSWCWPKGLRPTIWGREWSLVFCQSRSLSLRFLLGSLDATSDSRRFLYRLACHSFESWACAIQLDVRYFRIKNWDFPGSLVSLPLVKEKEGEGRHWVRRWSFTCFTGQSDLRKIWVDKGPVSLNLHVSAYVSGILTNPLWVHLRVLYRTY